MFESGEIHSPTEITPEGEKPSVENNCEKELSELQKNKIREFAQNTFSRYLSSCQEKDGVYRKSPDTFQEIGDVEEEIGKITESELFRTERGFDHKMQQGIRIFLEELIAFTKGIEKESIREGFATTINEALFSMTPNISSGLDPESKFELTAEISRIPEFQGGAGSTMLLDMAWEYEYVKEAMIAKIKKSPQGEKMDYIEIMEALAARSLSFGNRAIAEDLKELLEMLREENNSFFLDNYLDIATDKISQEEENPSQGIIVRESQRSNSRIQETLDEQEEEESNEIEKIFFPNQTLEPDEKIVRIGKDLIAITDQTNKPIKFAKIDPESFRIDPLPIKLKYLKSLQESSEVFKENPEMIQFKVIIEIMSKKIMEEEQYFSPQQKAQEWLRITNNQISEEEITGLIGEPRLAIVLPPEKKEIIMKGLLKKLSELDKEFEGKYIKADFTDYDTLMEKYNYALMKNESSEEIALLIQHFHKPEMRIKIEEKIGVDIKQIPFAHQLHFLKFLSEKNEQEVDRVRDFLSDSTDEENKINRITAFLSLEAGEDMGEKILGIGQKLDKETSNAIFDKYAEIINQIEKSREEIAQMFQKDRNVSSEEMRKIGENLLSRANTLIIDFSDEIENSENIKDIESDIIQKLSKINSENILFSSIFKTAYASGEINDFSELKYLDLTIRETTDLSEAEKEEIKKIIEKNYSKDRNRLANITAGIEKSFADNVSKWYLLKKQKDGEDKIISTMRFDKQNNGNLYAATFAVDPEFKNSAIGKAMNEKVLDSINETETTVAISKVGDPCSLFHINQTGWVVNGTEKNKNADIFYYKILRNKETRDAKYSDKTDGSELIEKFYNKDSSLRELLEKQSEKFVLRLNTEDQDDLEKINEAGDHGYAITRLIPKENNSSEIYHLFERADY
ncbi:MAG: hypothetical protein WCX10_08120 [Bacteroidales bacterium]|nr:hypothetical protein [Candidatus Paceibacterota bacterium]